MIGAPGTGKSRILTQLAGLLAARGWRLLVYDPKDDPEAALPGAVYARSAEAARRAIGRDPIVIYRPPRVEMSSLEEKIRHWDRVVDRVLALGNYVVVDHELRDHATAERTGAAYDEAFRKGRSMKITLLYAVQSPVEIPRDAIRFAKTLILMYLPDPRDLDVVARIVGPRAREPFTFGHDFWLWTDATHELVRCGAV